MMPSHAELQKYKFLLEKFEQDVAESVNLYRNHLQCKSGCSSCCVEGFKIRFIEFMDLVAGLNALPEETLNRISNHLNDPSPERKGVCPLLIDNACSVYAHRPFLCRAWGVFVKTENAGIGTCPLNFQEFSTKLHADETIKYIDMNWYIPYLDELSLSLWSDFSPTALIADPEPAPTLTIREYITQYFFQNKEIS